LLRARLKPNARRERVELADGDFLDLDWVRMRDGQTLPEGAPLVVVLHGLEGSASSGYACQLYLQLIEQKLQPVGLNFRGCSGEPNRLPRAYHSGETGDLAHVVELLRERFPTRPIGAVGVSLGGNVLLKYLGENKDEQGQETVGRRDRREPVTAGGEARRGVAIDAAAAISVPFDLSAGADFIERGFSKTYRSFLVRKLQRKVRAKQQLMRGEIDYEGALQARSFREFDQAVIVPIHGFADAEDYYRKSSSAQFLDAIAVPTLLIQSLDDPFLPPDRVPRQIAQANPNVRTEFTRRGGHVGFVTGAPWSPAFWGERRAAQFVAKRLRGAT
jgi:predicted alpha/beta-fold hydrolase